MSSSAALFSVPVKERFFEQFPNLFISDSIGSSEGGFNGISQLAKGNASGGSTGGLPRVNPMADVIVVDDDMQPLAPGDGQVGKVARTGNIPLGYYKDEEKTARTFLTGPDGRRYVVAGDFARWEEDGTITLLGRGSVCINTGGEKVFPEEVEGALKSHPDVFDALVVGVPDDRWGSAVTAVVQPAAGSTPTLDDLTAHCRAKVAGYKVPRHLVARRPDRALPRRQARLPVGDRARQGEGVGMSGERRPNILLVISDQERSRSWLPSDVELPWRQKLVDGGVDLDIALDALGAVLAVAGDDHDRHAPRPARGVRQHDLPVAHVAGHGDADHRRRAGRRRLPVELPRQVALHLGPHPDMEAYGYLDWEGNDQHYMGWAGTGVHFDPLIAESAAQWLDLNAVARRSRGSSPWRW